MSRRVVVFTGGVGGAKLVVGLASVLDPAELTIVVNTGDDFTHWGLPICPDLDTVMYTLAGLSHPEQGWGLAGETFHALEMMDKLGGPAWFRLGDRDLATHLRRRMLLDSGLSLTRTTQELTAHLDVSHTVLPMADLPRRTIIETDSHGDLIFNDWFVRHRTQPVPRAVRYEGEQQPTPAVMTALDDADLVIFGPSNPYVSIGPILTLAGVRKAVAQKRVVAVSPIVGGEAVKGPLAEMLRALDRTEPSAEAIWRHYDGLLDGLVVESGDRAGIDCPVLETSTIMATAEHKTQLASETLRFASELS